MMFLRLHNQPRSRPRGVGRRAPPNLAIEGGGDDRAPWGGVRATVVVRSPAGLAGLVRLPRRAA